MIFDRFSDELMIGDFPDEPDQTECKQCGETCWVDVCGQEFCNDGCAAVYWR